MKGKLIIIAMIAISMSAMAQEVKVETGIQNIGGDNNPCYIVTIPKANVDIISEAWKSEMKKAKAKVKGKDKQFADNAILPDISTNSVDVYSNFIQEDSTVKMIVAFSMGGIFLTPEINSDASKAAIDMFVKFAQNAYKEQLKSDISLQKQTVKETQKDIKKSNKEAKKLDKKNKKLAKKMNKNQEEIENLNQNAASKESQLQSDEEKLKDLKQSKRKNK